MKQAIELAAAAGTDGEVPVGAIVVDAENRLIATGENRRERIMIRRPMPKFWRSDLLDALWEAGDSKNAPSM